MYKTDFICTYKMMDTDEDREMLYKIQLLQAFDLDKWDKFIINLTLEELYNSMSNDKGLALILSKTSSVKDLQFLISNTELETDKNMLIFNLLFQYEYFDLFHNCISGFMRTGEIGDKSLQKLMNVLI
jgi:hypothetical protein